MFYNKHGLSKRTFENRIVCMNITKERYFEDLEKLRLEEQTVHYILNNTED